MSCTEILICTTCRPPDVPREAPAPGGLLLEAVRTIVAAGPQAQLRPAPMVRGIACLSGCGRACTVAFQAAGKHAYLFGDMQADAATAADVVACAALHQQSTDGLLPRSSRPERLRKGILAKLPPLDQPAACPAAEPSSGECA